MKIRKKRKKGKANAVLPLAYRPADAAKVFGIGRTHLYALIKSGEILLIKIGPRTSVIPRSSLEDFLSRRSGGCAHE